MFKGIKPGTFLSTHQEWHALVVGFFEILPPWKPRYNFVDRCQRSLKREYHYYLTGRGLGFVALLLILIGLTKLTKEVLL